MSQNDQKPVAEILALAARYQAAGRHADAERILMAAHKAQPRDIDILGELASLARRRGAHDEAIARLSEAAEIAPDNPGLVGNLGNAYRAAGALDQAISCYRRVLEAVPESIAALNNLGLTLRAKGDLDGAVAAYRQALAIDPGSAEVQSNLGVALIDQGAPAEARALLEGALRARPGSIEARTNLGSAFRALGRLDDAIAAFRAVIATAPDHAEAHNNLANTLQDAGHLEEAIEAYHGALRLDPDNPRILRNLAMAHSTAGQYDRAAGVVARLAQIDETGADRVSAVDDLAKVEADPDDPRGLEGLAYVHFLLGEDDEARRLYRRVLELDPDAATARHILDSLSGNTTNAAPERYVEAIFDEYASRFETSLLDDLGYSGPEVVRRVLASNVDGAALENVLDLGCGTGLIGEAIKRDFTIAYMEGVDLSAKMVEQAAQKEIYDKLNVGECVAHLDAGDTPFQLVTAGDVFIYSGDLSPAFRAVHRRLSDGGLFFFTVEAHNGEGFALQRTARYAHSLSYIRGLAREVGFRQLACEEHDIRRDSGKPIRGYGILLQKA